MTVESASYISQLDDTLPLSGDKKREGDNHIRLVKDVLKTQFPNFGTAAMNATTTELNYVVGVTSGIQAQINTKATKAGDTYTGAHDFTGAAPTVPTATAGDSSAKAASTAFVVGTAFSAALPGQAGNAGRTVRTDGTSASWGSIYGSPQVISTNTTAATGTAYLLTASLTLTLPATPAAGDCVFVHDASGSGTCVIGRGGENIMGLAEDLTLNTGYPYLWLVYADATRGWVLG